MKLYSWNVNGIRAVHRKGAINFIPESGADIFCIQETKAHRNQLVSAITDIPEYTAYFSEAERKGYSGVALYTKKTPDAVYRGMGVERFDAEGRLLRCDFNNISVITVYWPNGRRNTQRLQYKLDFYDTFRSYCDELVRSGRSLIICGDLNTAHKPVDLADPERNESVSGFLPVERRWIDEFVAAGYVDTFREFSDEPEQYTWWDMRTRARRRNVGWRLDYFFVSADLKDHLTDAFIRQDITGSDHCPVGMTLA